MKAITVNTGEIIAQGLRIINPGSRDTPPMFNHSYRLVPRWVETSKYKPHQGKRECARRVRQMAKRGGDRG